MREPFITMLAGWGRCPVVTARVVESEDLEAITAGAALARGLGRSYGDSALPPANDGVVALTPLADRLLAFDERTGLLRAEAGLSLLELNRLFLRRGWFTPVTPGTQFVTLGGMVAADVHGKNHHVAGCFGEHVRRLKLRLADGRVVECSDTQEPELFRATIGGMGLTGHILEVEFFLTRIPAPWIWCESERIPDLDTFIVGLKRAANEWPFTVGWIDCLTRGRHLGRGILIKGRWAEPAEAPRTPPSFRRTLRLPCELPEWLLAPLTVRAFNFLYYWRHWPRARRGVAHPQAFFYPLDAIEDWNRMYGRRGFTQYQCVLPHAEDNGPARRFLELLTSLGGSSFLCVIKDCGAEGKGMLSFPRPGVSIALDIPVRGDTAALVAQLNERVLAENGRVYLAKDAFTRPEHFRKMEPRLAAWQKVRRRWDPAGRLRSAQSVRLLDDAA
jgi:FAD/FMN-containing dehydrogenase